MSNLDKVENEVLKARIKAERAILKELEEQYAEALKEIDDHIAQLLGSQNANLPHMINRVEYQRMIKQQVQAALDKLHSREYESVNAYLNDCYTDAFVGTMYTLHQQDMPVIVPIDQNQAVKAITLDTRLNDTMYEEMGKDISQLKKTIRQEITRGITTGMMYSDIARNISNAAGIPMRRARNIARTEAGRVQEQASHDAAMKAVSRGANLVKQWSAIRDAKTRDAHRMLHKQTRELNEYFEIDGKKAMHPHDFGDPALDCNCRCTTLHVARASLDEDTLKRMQEDAHAHGLLVKDSKALGHAQAKNIGEFKKSYLKAAETVEITGKKAYNRIVEMLQKHSEARKHFKPLSTDRFDQLTIGVRKQGAIVMRGTKEVEEHLKNMGASAATLGDVLLFNEDTCLCEVLEETYHFMQNMQGMNNDKPAKLQIILNEIDAKEYVIRNAAKYKLPREELEHMQRQLESYKNELAEYWKGND